MAMPVKGQADIREVPLVPWFDVPDRATRDVTIVFGHWSTLGLVMRSDVICLDTGCIWGGHLTAVRLQDRRVVQVACKQSQNPFAQD
jgi:bis(5'-nucleosyl)-tetraphosphatase (symmetrical)